MSAPFFSFLYTPSANVDHDHDDNSSINSDDDNDDAHLQHPPLYTAAATIYVAIITQKDGSVKTKCLNPSALWQSSSSNSSAARGRKRAFSGNALFSKKPTLTLQKKAKHLLLWSSGKRDEYADQHRRGSSMGSVTKQRSSMGSVTTALLEAIPNEVMMRILVQLDSPSLARLQQVSKKLHAVCNDNHVWHRLFCNNFFQSHDPLLLPPPAPFLSSRDYRQLYRERVVLDQRWQQGHSQVSYVSQADSHRDSIYSMAWIQGTRTLVSASRDRTIKLWHVDIGACTLTRATPHTGSILSIATAAHQHLAVTGSSDTTCTVWQLPEWEVVQRFADHEDSVLSTVILEDGYVGTGSRDGTVRIWHARSGHVRHVLRGHTEPVNAIKRVDSRRLASASGDGSIRIWSIQTGDCLHTLTGDIGGLSCLEVVPKGASRCDVWACGLHRAIQIWSLDDGSTTIRSKIIASGHTDVLRSIDYFDGRIVTAGYDKVLKVWDTHTAKCTLSFQSGHEGKIFTVLMNRSAIVSAGHDRRIMVLDFAKGLSPELM